MLVFKQQKQGLKHPNEKKKHVKKYLIGSYYLDQALKENKIDQIKTIMDKYLKRNSDRNLFDLELLAEEETI